jgi:hypothetical protein
MICHKYKCIFVHQRKNAGTSIIGSFGYTPQDPEWHLFNEGSLSEEWQNNEEFLKDYLVFTVVRNPWERFVSGWKYLPAYKNLSLDQVIENLPQKGHDYRHLTRPQLDSLVDEKNNFIADVVIRFENIEEDYLQLSKLLGKPFVLPNTNITQHRKLDEYVNQSQIDFVGKHFKKDIDYFSYRFE